MENSTDISIWISDFVYAIKIGLIIFIIFVFLWKSLETRKTFDFSQVLKNLAVSLFLGLFAWYGPSYLIKIYGYEASGSDDKNSKKEKMVELSENEKLKKLNTYRKTQGKEILLVEKNQSDAYLEYLKKNKLDKKALK